MYQKCDNSSEKHLYEFIASAELFTPTNSSFKEHAISDRKLVRSESLRHPEQAFKKLKRGSVWISPLVRPAVEAGQWRAALCKLLDTGSKCSSFIYIDDAILCHAVCLHDLHQTDIRLVDPSMVCRKDCIRVAPVDSQPFYLRFNDTDTCNTWMVLLKSYAIPEIYGPPSFPHDGGLYRMWRKVDLLIIQGRYLGNPKALLDPSTGSTTDQLGPQADPVDLDAYCEIQLNGTVVGRTSVKAGIGSPEWREHFLFADLPPFDALEVYVWKEKRFTKAVLLGSIRIALTSFRRGEDIEGWFPVAQPLDSSRSIQVGDVRMKLRVDEEIILPHCSYESVLAVLRTRNILEWMDDFERKLQLRTLFEPLMYIAVATNEFINHIVEYADREVDGTPSSHNTLFRGNTVFTKTMELAMLFYGRTFLEDSIGKTIHRLCSAETALEVDPARSGKDQRGTESEVEELIKWCQEIWDSIYVNRNNCPHEIRRLFGHVRELVENHYKHEQGRPKELPWQSVSAFCFLRFIIPAILHPYQFGLYPGPSSPSVQRTLTLIAKVIQSLANLNVTVQKEEYMRGVKGFLQQNLEAMIDYILVVSTPLPEAPHPPIRSSHQRLQIVNSLCQRGTSMSILGRESVPLLPHLLDVPRQLACISSSLVRRMKAINIKGKLEDQDDHLCELYSRCLEVEEMSLQRVSQIAGFRSSSATRGTTSSTIALPQHQPSLSPTPRRKQGQGPSSSPLELPQHDSVPPTNNVNPSGSPSSSVPIALGSSLRRGSLSNVSSTPMDERLSRSTSRTRFLRFKSVSADGISPFTSHPRGSLRSSTRSFEAHVRPTSGCEELGKKGKNILTVMFPRR